MLIQSIRYTFSSDDADRAARILTELTERSIEEPGVLSFRVARSKDDPTVFVLWEEYRDPAALTAHTQTEHFKRLALEGIRRLAKERVGDLALPLV